MAVSADRVDVTYLLDQAEIPTFQERGRPPGAVLARKRAEIVRGLALTVAGAASPCAPAPAASASRPARAACAPRASSSRCRRGRTTIGRTVRLRDATFAGRAGWKAIVSVPGRGTAVRATSRPTTRPLA